MATAISYSLPASTRDVSLRAGAAGNAGLGVAAQSNVKDALASMSLGSGLLGPDEKGAAGDEMPSSFIPLALARTKMHQLSSELASMKARHMQIIDQITAKYERMTEESRQQFEGVVDEVKARASLRLRENKAQVEELRVELVRVQEAQAAKNEQYRAELKAATSEQGKLAQELLDRSAEMANLQSLHREAKAQIKTRQAEIDTLMQTRVAREEHDALAAEKDALSARLVSAESAHALACASLQSDLDAKNARLSELEGELSAAQASVAAKEEELLGERAILESTRSELAAAQEALERAAQGSEESLSAARAETAALQERLGSQEARVGELESQLLVAQASVGAGSGQGEGSSNGPARLVPVQDPELQSRVRSLEAELNRLARENVDLGAVITAREEAIVASNERLEAAKKNASSASASASAPVAADAAAAEDGAESEYEEQEVEEQFTELVPAAAVAAPGASGAAAAASDPHSADRARLSASVRASEGDVSRLSGEISSLEGAMKPKVGEYKRRLAEFKTDSERKELEASLGLSAGVAGADGVDRALSGEDLDELGGLLESSEAQATLKAALANKFLAIKQAKAALEGNKVRLAELKASVLALKAEGGKDDQAREAEEAFTLLRNSMQADAADIKADYAAYEAEVKGFKEREGGMQALFARWKIDAQHEADKPRRLSPEHREGLVKLLELIRNKPKEREALKALADDVNAQNAKLKQLKAEREAASTGLAAAEGELAGLPPAPENAASAAAPTSQMVERTSTRTVRKRVRKAVGRSANGSAAPAPKGSVPSALLTGLKAIDLKGVRLGRFAGREYTPVTPTVFKAPGALVVDGSASAAAEASSPGSGAAASGSAGGDPDLQRRFDALKVRAAALEAQLSGSSSADSAALAAKESELVALREQLASLAQGDADQRVQALAAQLAAQKADLGAQSERHQARAKELQHAAAAATQELQSKEHELAKLAQQVSSLQTQLRAAKVEAPLSSPHSPDAGSVAPLLSPSPGAAAKTEVDPALLAKHEAALSSLSAERDSLLAARDGLATERDAQLALVAQLQTQVTALEGELAAQKEGVVSQLAAQEASLNEAHAARVGELEAQMSESLEKLKITKTKAKALHEALQGETATRQGLEVEKAGLESKVQGMETLVSEAVAKETKLTDTIAARDASLAQRAKEVEELLATKAALEKDVEFLSVRNADEVRRRKEFQFKYEEAKGKVRVYARVRPFSKHEIEAKEGTLLRPGTNEWTICINEKKKDYQGTVTDNWRPIEFDHVFQCGLENTKRNDSQLEIFEETKIFAELTVQGINCCVFAYGQSGTGKTFTMAGKKPCEENGWTTDLVGLKPRMIERVYQMKEELRKTHVLDISCYMLEIYLNKLEDVFWKLDMQHKYAGKKDKMPEPPELKVRVDAKKKVHIDNGDADPKKGIHRRFETKDEMQKYCDDAESTRRVRKTGLNEESSRSHLIFAIIVESLDKKTGKKTTGKLSLVDLAGSERAEKTNVEGLSAKAREAMMQEGIAINESLRMLKSVFRILGEANKPLEKGKKAEIVQYRGNMLTELMQDSLGGGAKTLMFVNVGPAASNISESVDSLAYGDLVKNITNEKVTADADSEEQIRYMGVQLRAYEAKFGPLE